MATLLEVHDLEVAYGRTVALKRISVTVGEGEIVGVVGQNGAGKSTLMWAICGVSRPRQGTIAFAGKPIVGQRPHRIVRLGVSLVPEGRRIFGGLTVDENLRLGATAADKTSSTKETRVQVLDLFPDLQPYLHSQAGKLSGGEQQQLAVARALLSRPRLLLLDEPSLGLAPMVTDRLFETLNSLRDTGVTLLLVEQNAARTIDLADRTYVLRSGSIVLEGEREDILSNREFQTAYLGFGATDGESPT